MSQIVKKKMRFDRLKKLDDSDDSNDVLLNRTHVKEVDSQLLKCRRQLDEMDADYRNFLLDKKRKENSDPCQSADECYGEEGNDPQYDLVLKYLTEHGKSYVLKYEENGLPVNIKYEEVHAEEECNPEPRRKLRSWVKQNAGPPIQMLGLGNENRHDSEATETKKLAARTLRNKAKIDDAERAKETTNKTMPRSGHLTSCKTVSAVNEGNACLNENCYVGPRTRSRSAMKQKIESSNCGLENQCKHNLISTNKTKDFTGRKSSNETLAEQVIKLTMNEIVPDPDYLSFLKNFKVVNKDCVYTYGGCEIVYDNNEGEHRQLEENLADEFLTDIQIIDGASFYNAGNESGVLNMVPTMASTFRQRLVKILKKPYDKEEHEKLWQDIKLHKSQERHLDLRNGRERSCPKNIDGKSYLDHYPDLKRELLLCKDDKPKCLNLLRGYFFWLENSPWDPFMPWLDADCLAIKPEPF